MLFNSLDFGIFLLIVYVLYWTVFQRSLRWQNFFLLVVSYVFYGWWDWRFLTLIFISSLVDYMVGRRLAVTEEARRRKLWLVVSLIVNLGMLGFFKYYNFFVDSFIDMFSSVGMNLNPRTLNIILPVGISFYTFQTVSYSIDVYRRQTEPSKDLIAFLAFVSFFPQLVAGPIERAKEFLPQFLKARTFDYNLAKDGLRQILWGLFKKVVIADTAGVLVDEIFGNYSDYTFVFLWFGLIYFAVQVYCDFSGYSDIAIGAAKLFGFRLMRNFHYPFQARDWAELWRRWHISLTTWFRDYLYFPLGGSRGTKSRVIFNVMVIFIVSGFWHGANWTYITWGAFCGLLFVPSLIMGRNRRYLDTVGQGRSLPTLKEFFQMVGTFLLFSFSLIFFRNESMTDVWHYFLSMGSFSFPINVKLVSHFNVWLLFGFMVVIEWNNRFKEYPFEDSRWPIYYRWPAYMVMAWAIVINSASNDTFIYFQF